MAVDTKDTRQPIARFKNGLDSGTQYIEISYPDSDTFDMGRLNNDLDIVERTRGLEKLSCVYIVRPSLDSASSDDDTCYMISYKRKGDVLEDQQIKTLLSRLLVRAGVEVEGYVVTEADEEYIDYNDEKTQTPSFISRVASSDRAKSLQSEKGAVESKDFLNKVVPSKDAQNKETLAINKVLSQKRGRC